MLKTSSITWIRPYLTQLLAASIACFVMMDIGLVIGWPSVSLSKLLPAKDNDTRDESELLLTSNESSWVVSISFLAAILSPLMLICLLDGFGRKLSLLAVAIPLLISWILIAVASNVVILYVGRFVAGISLGLTFPVESTFISEMASEKIRGVVGTMVSTSMLFGCFIAFCIGPALSTKIFAIISITPIIIFLLGFFWIPETPHFLLMKGKRDKARTSLVWLRRRDDVEEELTMIETSVLEDMKYRKNFSLGMLFRTSYNQRSLLISLCLMMFQQFSGGSAILSYAGVIFANSGLQGWTNYSLILLGLVQLVSGFLGGFVIDLAGRRKILMISSLFSTFFMLLEAIFFNLKYLGYETKDFSWIPLVGLLGYNVSLTPGLLACTWIVVSELFPTDVKVSAMMLIGMFGSIGSFTVNKIYEPIESKYGAHWAYYLFTSFLLISIPFVYFFLPETKQISLEDIQKKLNSRKQNFQAESSKQ